MVGSCVVPGCQSSEISSKKDKKDLRRFFSFPKNDTTVQVWRNRLKIPANKFLSTNMKVCELHFNTKNILSSASANTRSCLSHGAIPLSADDENSNLMETDDVLSSAAYTEASTSQTLVNLDESEIKSKNPASPKLAPQLLAPTKNLRPNNSTETDLNLEQLKAGILEQRVAASSFITESDSQSLSKAEEFLRLLEDKNIGSFKNFSSSYRKRLKLGSWRILQQSGLICFYQLKKETGFLDLNFQTRIMINQKLNMEIIQGENELASKNLPLKSWFQFQKTLDFYEKHQDDPVSAQVNLKKAAYFLMCIKESDLSSSKNLQLQHLKTELRDMLEDDEEESDDESDVETRDIGVDTSEMSANVDPADYLKVEVESDDGEEMMKVPAEKPMNFVFCGVKEKTTPSMENFSKSLTPEPKTPPILHTANKQVIFSCEQCEKRFQSQSQLRFHQLHSHPLKQPDKCSSCVETFYDKRLFQQHKVFCCPKPTEFFCEYCAKSFKSLYVLQDHLLRHQPDKKEKCTQCNKSFLPGNDMNKHVKRHLNLREHQCHICERTFTQAVALRDHLESHTDVKVRCPKCNKAFATTLNMKNHLRTRCDGIFKNDSDISEPQNRRKITFLHHKYTYSCFVEECERKFPLKKLLKEHLLKEHNVEIPNFERYCLECKQEFESDNIYYAHVKTHLCVHTCKLCGKGFRKEETLNKHEASHATSLADRPFACDQCELKFKTDSNLRSHRQTKHTKRQFGCKICGQRFVFCRQVENHVRVVHTNQKFYSCSVCHEQFKYIRAFKSHMYLRHDIKEVYGCDKCEAKFTQNNELRAHKHEEHGETYHGKKKEVNTEENYVVQENEIQQYDIISYQDT